MRLNINAACSLTALLLCAALEIGVQAQVSSEHNKTAGGPLARPADIEGRAWHIANYFLDKEQTWPHHGIERKGEVYITFESGVVGGSPGCGRFTGKYRRSGEQLTISAEWTDDKATSCDDEEKADAVRILNALSNVRRIHVEPAYWHSDALLLTDGKGSTEITLSPMQPGKDLSELQDSFWHLAQLEGSHADFPGVVIDIERNGITFSTPSCYRSFPFQYKLTGLEFFPASAHGAITNHTKSLHDRQLAIAFENLLHKISSYELSQGTLTFFGKGRHPIVVLNHFPQKGIENRRWRIAKYRGDGTQQTDEEGLIDAKSPAEITFLNGRVEGSPGCGGWVGTYKLSGDRLTLQAGAVLAGPCYPKEAVQSKLVENAFRGDLWIEGKDGQFRLRDQNRRARILLVPY